MHELIEKNLTPYEDFIKSNHLYKEYFFVNFIPTRKLIKDVNPLLLLLLLSRIKNRG